MNKKSLKIKQFFITVAQRMAGFSRSREIKACDIREII